MPCLVRTFTLTSFNRRSESPVPCCARSLPREPRRGNVVQTFFAAHQKSETRMIRRFATTCFAALKAFAPAWYSPGSIRTSCTRVPRLLNTCWLACGKSDQRANGEAIAQVEWQLHQTSLRENHLHHGWHRSFQDQRHHHHHGLDYSGQVYFGWLTTATTPSIRKHNCSMGKTVTQNTVIFLLFQTGVDFEWQIDLGNTQYIDAFQRGTGAKRRGRTPTTTL